MKTLRWYILREVFAPFLLCLLFFTFIFLAGNLVKLADLLLNKGVSVWDVLKLLVLLIPSLLNYIIPTSALAAVLLVFGRLAQNNEITAMKAGGINLFSVMSPVLLASFLLSVVTLFLSDQVQSDAEFASRQMIKQLVFRHPMAYLESGKFIKDFQDYIIHTERIENNRLYGVTIYQPQEGKATRTVMAEWGEIVSSPEENALKVKLYNGTSDEPNPDDPGMFYKLNFKTFELPPIQLGKDDPSKMRKKTRELRLDEIIYALRRDPKLKTDPTAQREYRTAFHRKISFSLATFVFTFIGLPLAIITRRGEAVISFSLAMGIVAIYYVLFIWARAMALENNFPVFLILWFPNLFMIGCGIFLTKRVLSV